MTSTTPDTGDSTSKPMSFWDHIDTLRSSLLWSVAVVIILSIAYFAAMPWLFDNVVLAPCHGDFPLYKLFNSITALSDALPDFYTGDFDVSLINIQLTSQFFTHISTSFWFAVVTAFPIVLMILWRFVSPGLYRNEKRGVKKALVFGNIMFYVGMAVGYFIVFPLTLRFLAQYQLSEAIPNTISLSSYIDNFMMLIFVMGLVFELPIISWALGKTGILNRSILKRYRRHAIVVVLIIAAIITPTGDPFTLIVVFFPIYILWELSALLLPSSNKQKN